MGAIASFLAKYCLGRKEHRVIMVGLDGAGKTTILYQLKHGDLAQTIPTIGFNVEKIQVGPVILHMWDLGGQFAIRDIWQRYLHNGVSAIIFVLDCADLDRVFEARMALDDIVHQPEADGATLLVLANKQDLGGAIRRSEVAQHLGIHDLEASHSVEVFEVTALTGKGLWNGLNWLISELQKKN